MLLDARLLYAAHALYSCRPVAAMCASPREAVSQPVADSLSVHPHLRFPAARVDMTHRHLHAPQSAVAGTRGCVGRVIGEGTEESPRHILVNEEEVKGRNKGNSHDFDHRSQASYESHQTHRGRSETPRTSPSLGEPAEGHSPDKDGYPVGPGSRRNARDQ